MSEYVVAIVGDTSFCESYDVRLDGERFIESKGREYAMRGVAALVRTADLIIANLETPLTLRRDSPFEGFKKYIHWSDPVQSTRMLREHNIGAVSLANNHTLDYGLEGLYDTFESLDNHHIAWFGAGRTASEARRPYRKKITVGSSTLPLVVIGAYLYRPVLQRRFRYYAKADSPGVNRLSISRVADQIVRIKNKSPRAFVVVYPHWGENYAWNTPEDAEQARTLAQAGADLILGHGSHMLGGIERMGATWALYSLGNFVFGAPGRYAVSNAPPYSLAAHLVLKDSHGSLSIRVRLYPLHTDNRQTAFQSRPVNEQEIAEVAQLLRERSTSVPADTFEPKHNSLGFYFELPVS